MNTPLAISAVSDFNFTESGVFRFDSREFHHLQQNLTALKVCELILQIRDRIKNKIGNHGFYSFLNGVPYADFKIEEMNHLTPENFMMEIHRFPCSIKITGLQLVSPEIRSLTQFVFEKFGFAMTCNLYLTPAGEKNCFTYHIDPHKVFILQIWGQKLWHFPLDQQTHRHIFSPEVITAEEHQNHSKTFDLLIEKGQGIAISKGILHKAIQTGTGPSIHLSFAGLQPDVYDFFKFAGIDTKSFDLKTLHNLRNDCHLSSERIYQYIHELNLKYNDVYLEEALKRFLEFRAEEALFITKFGRNYKTP